MHNIVGDIILHDQSTDTCQNEKPPKIARDFIFMRFLVFLISLRQKKGYVVIGIKGYEVDG